MRYTSTALPDVLRTLNVTALAKDIAPEPTKVEELAVAKVTT